MFDYKPQGGEYATSAHAAKPREAHKGPSGIHHEPANKGNFEWKPSHHAEPEAPKEEFSWDKPANFEFNEPARSSEPSGKRPQKPAIFAQQPQSTTQTRASAPPPAEKKEVKKQPAPAMIDLLTDSGPQSALPADLFEAPEPIRPAQEEAKTGPVLQALEATAKNTPEQPAMTPPLYKGYTVSLDSQPLAPLSAQQKQSYGAGKDMASLLDFDDRNFLCVM